MAAGERARRPGGQITHARPDGAAPEAWKKGRTAPVQADGRAAADRFNSGPAHIGNLVGVLGMFRKDNI